MALYMSNASAPVTLKQLGPSLAEAMMLIALGLASGAVAVIAKWAVDARIDRAVLNG
jgi:biopolymer transport protein ExbB/TolQ